MALYSNMNSSSIVGRAYTISLLFLFLSEVVNKIISLSQSCQEEVLEFCFKKEREGT